MKTYINRRNFLLGTAAASATALAPFPLMAQATPAVSNAQYIGCGKMNPVDLRHFYHAAASSKSRIEDTKP